MRSSAVVNTEQRLESLERRFPEYLREFTKKPPFRDLQLQNHLRTIDLRHRLGSASVAARDEGFADSLATTLKSWDIGVARHGSDLVTSAEFSEQLRQNALAVGELERLRIDDEALDDERATHRIWLIIRDLDLVRHKAQPVERRVVSGTKALHHLLPNLVFPVDNTYTATFFGWDDFGRHAEQRFKFVFQRVAAIARAVKPNGYVGEGWNSSPAKVLDNAIVGFCLAEGVMSRTKKDKAILRNLRQFAKQNGREDLLESGRGDDLIAWLKEHPKL